MVAFLALVGLAGLVLATVVLVRGHVDWARLASRRAGGVLLAGSLVVLAVGASMAPASQQRGSARLAGSGAASETPSAMTPSASPTASSGPSDPDEAQPASTAAVTTAGLKPAAALSPSACRAGDPLANVYHPYRLQVVARCSTVSGVVRTVRKEDDGDVHFDLELDQAYVGMLTPGNYTYQHGRLVVELVPADETGCVKGEPPRAATGTYDYGICTGADEPTPTIGSHVYVTGPYVLDHIHNWAEIHPAWLISTSKPATTKPPAAAPAPAAPAPAPAPARTSAPASPTITCQASMSNASPTQNSTTDVIVHTGSGGASVSATAHYKSKDTTNTGTSASNAVASIPFAISRATKGYTVRVDVTVTLGGHSASCATSFTPQ